MEIASRVASPGEGLYMINKTNLMHLANTSPMMRIFLYDFSGKVVNAVDVSEYVEDAAKPKFDMLVEQHDIARLCTENYQTVCAEIREALGA